MDTDSLLCALRDLTPSGFVQFCSSMPLRRTLHPKAWAPWASLVKHHVAMCLAQGEVEAYVTYFNLVLALPRPTMQEQHITE
jgi:hypothetical protein